MNTTRQDATGPAATAPLARGGDNGPSTAPGHDEPDRLALGRSGEEAVAALIEGWGWEILDRNWSCRLGEIDIVALDGDDLAIIEVKTRRSLAFGHPAEAVNRRKLARLRVLAGQWLSAHQSVRFRTLRIDIAAVLASGDEYECEYLRGVTL